MSSFTDNRDDTNENNNDVLEHKINAAIVRIGTTTTNTNSINNIRNKIAIDFFELGKNISLTSSCSKYKKISSILSQSSTQGTYRKEINARDYVRNCCI